MLKRYTESDKERQEEMGGGAEEEREIEKDRERDRKGQRKSVREREGSRLNAAHWKINQSNEAHNHSLGSHSLSANECTMIHEYC